MIKQDKLKYSFTDVQYKLKSFLTEVELEHENIFSKTNAGKVFKYQSNWEKKAYKVSSFFYELMCEGVKEILYRSSRDPVTGMIVGGGAIAIGSVVGLTFQCLANAPHYFRVWQLPYVDKAQVKQYKFSMSYLKILRDEKIDDIPNMAKGDEFTSIKLAKKVIELIVKNQQYVIESSENLMKQKHALEQYLDNILNNITNDTAGTNLANKKPDDSVNVNNPTTTNPLAANTAANANNIDIDSKDNDLVTGVATTAKAS